MKRQRSFSYKNRPYKRPRTTATTQSRFSNRPKLYSSNEKKVQDIQTQDYQVDNVGSFTLLCNPVLGSDFNERIGRKVVTRNLYIKGAISTAPSTVIPNTNTNRQHVRMILFVDLQPNAATPVVTDLLNTATPSSHLNLNNRDRFRVIADKEYVLDPYVVDLAVYGAASTCNQVKYVKKYKRWSQEIIFNATNGGTIADITSGAMYMFWIGDQAPGAASIFTGATRVRYVDA